MNWKDAAIERLQRYSAMKTATQNLPDQLAELEASAGAIKASRPDRVKVKAGTDSTDALINNLVLQEELRHALNQAKLWVRITERALGALMPEEKLVLHRLFIAKERGAIDRLGTELGCEQSTVYRKRDQALQHFTVALYGFAETQYTVSGKTV